MSSLSSHFYVTMDDQHTLFRKKRVQTGQGFILAPCALKGDGEFKLRGAKGYQSYVHALLCQPPV